MPKGNYGALRQMTPLKNDLGDVAREQERVDAQSRREANILARQKKADDRLDKADKQKADDRKVALAKSIPDVYTGIDSVDKGLAVGVQAAAQRTIALDDLINRTDKNDPRYLDYVMEMGELQKFSTNLKQLTDKHTAYAQDITAGIASGKYSKAQNKELLAGLNGIYKDFNFTVGVGKDGKPMLNIGNYEGSRFTGTTEVGFHEFFDGTHLKDAVAGFKKEEWLKKLEGQLGTHTASNEFGDVTNSSTKINEESAKRIESDIEEFIGTKEEPSAQGRGIWEETYNQDPAKYDHKKLHDLLKDDANAMINTKQGRSEDEGSKTGKENEVPERGFEVITGKDGKPFMGMTTPNHVHKDAVGFQLQKDKKGNYVEFGIGDEKMEVSAFYLEPDDTILFTGKREKKIAKVKAYPLYDDDDNFIRDVAEVPAHTIWEDVEFTEMTTTERNSFAVAMGYKNYGELVKLSKDKYAAFGTAETGGWNPLNF